ncbi:MAG: FemAB family protein [Bacteroidota bacterium]
MTGINQDSFFDLADLTPVNIRESYVLSGLSVMARGESKAEWEHTLQECRYAPVAYSNMNLDFLFEIQKGNGIEIYDLSVIIFWDNKPVALWPLFLSMHNQAAVINGYDNCVLPPLTISSCSEAVEKKIVKQCLQLVNRLAMSRNIPAWNSTEIFTDTKGISTWHSQSMAMGASSSIQYELFINMQLEWPEIKALFRKSYKSLINSSQKLWTTGLMDDASDETVWNEFIGLHARAAGRKTRSDKSWDIHLTDIENKRSFLIYLRNSDDAMIGAGLFNTTRDEGLYASAAYDRSLFDKPVGHLVQYHAIQELKKRGVSWYKLGILPFASQMPSPSEKEINIGKFKQGFASDMFPRYMLLHTVNKEGGNANNEE